MLPVLRNALALPLVLAVAVPAARAQTFGATGSSSPDHRGFAQGAQDGRQEGRVRGAAEGRDQVLVRTFVDAFKELIAADTSVRVDAWRTETQQRAVADAAITGRSAGERAGREAALDEGTGGPATPPEPPEPPPLPADLDQCREPAPLVLELPSGREVTLEFALMPEAGVSLDYVIPEPRLPGNDQLRVRGRVQEALTGFDLDQWVEWYERGFQEGFRDSYHEERLNVSGEKKAELEETGRLAGVLESERRVACRTAAPTWREEWPRAWAAAWREGFDEARQATSERLAEGAVVELESATLVDADGDGVLAPGDEVRLRGTLVSHGQEAAATAGRWTALRGFAESATGELGPAPAPGASAPLDVVVGRVTPDAPPRASVVVMVEPSGGGREPIVGKTSRPASLESVTGSLDAVDGALVVTATAVVVSAARAGTLEGLRVLAGPETGTDVPALAAGARADVKLLLVAPSPASVGGREPAGRVTLVDAAGAPWDATEVTLAPSVGRLVDVASRVTDASAVAAVLVDRLAQEIADGDVAAAGAGPELAAFVAALAAASPATRQLLANIVTGPLLKRLEQQEASRKDRRRVKELLLG